MKPNYTGSLKPIIKLAPTPIQNRDSDKLKLEMQFIPKPNLIRKKEK